MPDLTPSQNAAFNCHLTDLEPDIITSKSKKREKRQHPHVLWGCGDSSHSNERFSMNIAIQGPGAKHALPVLSALEAIGKPASAYDIISHLNKSDDLMLAPQSVYRALDRLIERGFVHKVASLNAYVVCRCDHHVSPAFAVCRTCGSTIEFDLPEAVKQLMAWSERNGFTLEATTLELRGTCASCRKPRVT